jgi:hypothetical protein
MRKIAHELAHEVTKSFFFKNRRLRGIMYECNIAARSPQGEHS